VEWTKGKKYRTVPLNDRARHVLEKVAPDLFSGLKPETVSHKFNDLMKRLSMPQFKLHSLRHSFATKIIAKGADIYTVKELLGHQDIRTSMVYAKVSTDKLRDAVDKL
jgi:site-specific recombinase XerD